MGVCDLLRHKETMAGDSIFGTEVGFGEYSRYPKARIGSHGYRDFIRFQVLPRKMASSKTRSAPRIRTI